MAHTRNFVVCLTALLLLIGPGRTASATAAPVEVARWGEGALTDGGIATAPNGQIVAVATTIGVRLHQPVTGTLLRTLVTPVAVTSLVFAPDSRTLAVGLRDGTVELWRVAGGQRLRRLHGLAARVWQVFFTAGGQVVAARDRDTLQVWRVADGSAVHIPGGDNKELSTVAFAPDGQTYAVAVGCKLQLRRWRDGAILRTLEATQPSCAEQIAFAPDGQTLAESVYGGVVLWRLRDGVVIRTFLQENQADTRSLVFAPDGQTLLVGANHGERDPPFDYATYLQLWRVADGVLLHTWEGNWLNNPAFTPDSRMLMVAAQDAQVHRLRPADGTSAGRLTTLPNARMRFALAPDGQTLAVSQGPGGIHIRRVSDGRVVRTLGADLPAAQAVTFAPDGKTLAVSTGATLYLWRTADGRLLWHRPTGFDQVSSIVFTATGADLVLAGFRTDNQEDNQTYPAQVRRTADGTVVRMLGTDPAYRMTGAAKAGIIAVASSVGIGTNQRSTVQIRRTTDWQVLRVLTDTWGTDDLAISPDGQQLVEVGSDTGVQLWRLAQDSAPRTLVDGDGTLGLSGPVAVAFAPDGRTLAVGDADSTLQLRRATDGQVLATLPGHAAAITQLAFTPNGRLLVSAAWDGTLRIWRVR